MIRSPKASCPPAFAPLSASNTMPLPIWSVRLLQHSTRVCHPAPSLQGNLPEKGFTVESVLTEWLSLILRWLHVVAAIAWIGSSFYFIHLDLSLKRRGGLPEGVQGDAWQVHGG